MTENTKGWQGCEATETPYCFWEFKMAPLLFKTVWQLFCKVKHIHTTRPSNSSPSYLPKLNEIFVFTKKMYVNSDFVSNH